MFFISFLPPGEHTSTQPLRRDYARLVRPVPTKNGSVISNFTGTPDLLVPEDVSTTQIRPLILERQHKKLTGTWLIVVPSANV
jgi:hypothetical protein